jgi:4-cresol dehydrogenase (hydroxylating)
MVMTGSHNLKPAPARNAAGPAEDRFSAAVRSWIAALGSQYVDVTDSSRDRYGRTSGTHGIRPTAILRPASTAEVAQVLRIASRHCIAVHPISIGKNWGYGDACPPRENQAIIDLGRMNRIIEVNTELCYAVIEPGVTQGQLHQYLTEHKIKLWMDATGAGPDASVVGNILERGFGHTRYGDRIQSTCGMEVALADGRVLNTGFGHYANAKAHRTYRHGIGPMLDGLFSQSNFGVVTRLGIWLMPEPEDFTAFFFFAPNHDDLADVIDRLAPLRMQGLLQSTIHIGNDLRVISGRMRYPWERAAGRTPLPADVRAELRKEFHMGAWNGGGAIYGTRETVAATRKVVARALKPYHPKFLNDRGLRNAHRIQWLLGRFGLGTSLGARLKSVEPVYGLLKGIPTHDTLRGAAWRVRGAMPDAPADPLDCHAGVMWVAPTLPATGRDAREIVARLTRIYEKHAFEPLITFTMLTERSLCCVTNVAFDRREVDEAARAKACYEELTDDMMHAGYIPYRAAQAGSAKLAEGSTTFWDVVADLKHAIDPQGVISPGRYQPAA